MDKTDIMPISVTIIILSVGLWLAVYVMTTQMVSMICCENKTCADGIVYNKDMGVCNNTKCVVGNCTYPAATISIDVLM